MSAVRLSCVCAAVLLLPPLVPAQVKGSTVAKQIDKLRSLPDDQRPTETINIAKEIQTLPAGTQKVGYADALSHLVTEGDQGADAIEAVAYTLAKALAETPIPAKKDEPAMPYMDLARLTHYETAVVALNDPSYAKAQQQLDADDADIAKADFTLKDLHNKPWTLSELRGKIVMVNFWATWCPPCRVELPALDAIYTHFEPQGLVVLSITDDDVTRVGRFLAPTKYHPPVLLDEGGKVHKLFHVTGIPRTYLFGRDGKLLAVAIDQRTMRQFLQMLSNTDLHN